MEEGAVSMVALAEQQMMRLAEFCKHSSVVFEMGDSKAAVTLSKLIFSSTSRRTEE
jgi:hypothetical protein